MNDYGARAMRHWRRWLPERFAAIPNPGAFFTELGEQAATQIAELSEELAGTDPPGETYLAKLGRLNAARQQAEEIVVRELVLPDPETSTPPEKHDEGWIPMVEDPAHPYWAAQERADQER